MAENNLRKSLQNLLNRPPLGSEKSEQESFVKWLQNNGNFIWIQQLEDILTEHRNIGYDWQLSRYQKESLEDYNYANRLLVDCLKSSCRIEAVVREEIEDTLLLPIAEIEKRKRER